MKTFSLRNILIFLSIIGISNAISCSMFKPLSKEEAVKKIVTGIIDNCKADKKQEVASQFDEIMPAEEKQRRKIDKFDYSNPEIKRQVDRLCSDYNSAYANGYEFGKEISQGQVFGFEIYPKGESKGSLFAFKQENDKYILVDIDPAKR
jgi:hypothetical protein